MDGYLDNYGAGDERRSRLIRDFIVIGIAVVAIAAAAYLILKNYPERQAVNRFLSEVNGKQYGVAYRTWGCTPNHPCSAYSYQKFLEDWGAKQNLSDWKISDVDGCPTGVVITVSSHGADPQPLWVQRSDHSLSFSPWPECQGKKWRFRQFFHRVAGG